jgi:hypothetical protein
MSKPETRTLSSISRDALEARDGNWKEAADLTLDELRADAELLWAVVEPHLPKIVWESVRKEAHAMRRSFFHATEDMDEVDAAHEEASKRLREVHKNSIYDYPLSGGLKLGDATKPQVLSEADWHAALERGNGRQKWWLRAVARQMPKKDNEAIVRDHVAEDVIESLHAEAESK